MVVVVAEVAVGWLLWLVVLALLLFLCVWLLSLWLWLWLRLRVVSCGLCVNNDMIRYKDRTSIEFFPDLCSKFF